MVRLIVCGNRDWTDAATIRAWLSIYPKSTTVLHGATKGANNIAGKEARKLGFKVESFPANWLREGERAGPNRNKRIVERENPTHCLAFGSLEHQYQTGAPNDAGHMVGLCRLLGIPVQHVTTPGQLP